MGGEGERRLEGSAVGLPGPWVGSNMREMLYKLAHRMLNWPL